MCCRNPCASWCTERSLVHKERYLVALGLAHTLMYVERSKTRTCFFAALLMLLTVCSKNATTPLRAWWTFKTVSLSLSPPLADAVSPSDSPKRPSQVAALAMPPSCLLRSCKVEEMLRSRPACRWLLSSGCDGDPSPAAVETNDSCPPIRCPPLGAAFEGLLLPLAITAAFPPPAHVEELRSQPTLRPAPLFLLLLLLQWSNQGLLLLLLLLLLLPAESGRRYRLAALLLSDIAGDVLLVAREEEEAAERCSILPRVVLRSEGDRGEASASSTAAADAAAAAPAPLAAVPAPNRNFRSNRLSKGLLSLAADPRFSGG